MNKTLHLIMVVVLSVIGIVFLNAGFLFLLLGFMPTMVAYFVDETPKMDLYKTIRATNLAGMLPTLMPILSNSYPGAALQVAMGDMRTWLVVISSAACGWLLVWVCRAMSYVSIFAASEARISQIEDSQKVLLKEWGDELKEYVITTQ